MAVLKRKRKESDFEVYTHFYQTRKEITDLLLRDFGYSQNKAQKHMERMFGDREYESLNDDKKRHYDLRKARDEAFDQWFIEEQRKTVLDCLRKTTEYVFMANSIYPQYMEELVERRIYQDKAIGQCNRLLQELQYTMATLPVDINKYTRFADCIQKEISLIKGWRKADNKFKKQLEEK